MLHAIRRLLFERILHTVCPPRQSRLGQAQGTTKHPKHHPRCQRLNQRGFHLHVQEVEASSHGRKVHAQVEGVLGKLRNAKGHTLSILQATIRTW